uniref:coiled-coil domain-containing protein 138-like isoform X2 n=1 Tax=Gasterosteus aculeatus aculeatus TaxID=481459 RepID=UPI001A999A5D|nr:coiled-coil domain-containing protein 138-like isoform X2 [Gasterosteus aculeatus aculeatus]
MERRKQLPEDVHVTPTASGDEAARRCVWVSRSKRPGRELKCCNTALRELFKTLSNHPDLFGSDRGLQVSNEDLSGDSAAALLHDSQAHFTETDVTLPSCLDDSSGSQESHGESQRTRRPSDSCRSSSLVLATVYQEMMTIYEQLKAQRYSQQRWERELQQRERRLKQQEEEAVLRLAGMEEMLHTRLPAEEEKHQQQVSQLQEVLREKCKENRRLKCSFDTIKELNEGMKKQLNEVNEQNKKLESQSKRVQARLENLQRCSDPTRPKLLTLLLDWVVDGQTLSPAAGSGGKGVSRCGLPPELVLNERCLTVTRSPPDFTAVLSIFITTSSSSACHAVPIRKRSSRSQSHGSSLCVPQVLPLLADQLQHAPLSEADLLLNLLRLIHWALRRLDSSTQHVALSATLRRIGEEASKPAAWLTGPDSEEADRPGPPTEAAGGACRTWPLSCSPCPHTRILSTLIILRTVTQADVLAQALEALRTELMSEESRGLFIHYGGVCVLLSVLRAGRGGLHTPVDVLMQLSEQSRYLNPFLEACSCEEFFQTASQLLKNPRLEFPALEKLSILLQKLSSIRKNRRLFERCSVLLQIQELNHNANQTHTFLRLNLRSILHNLR